MGELRKFYALADVVFVGRTLVDLGPRQHGSDMIEPAALGKPVIVGPYTGNFAEVMNKLRSADAVMEVTDEASLAQTVSVLLYSPEQALPMGKRAQQVIVKEKGATLRHAEVIIGLLNRRNRAMREGMVMA
jgi:3-deoxy-D-manno-octulosonic-acid transferase